MSDAMPPLIPAVPVPETLPEAAPAGTQMQDAAAQERARELSQQKLISGPTVSGFALRGKLGEGGMGIVYEAEQLALKRTVALKLILHGGHASAELLARFRGEAEVVARTGSCRSSGPWGVVLSLALSGPRQRVTVH
jgi:hypothetical protein